MGILREVTLHFIRQCFPSLFNTLHVSLDRGQVDSTDVVLSKSDPISIIGIPWQIIAGKVSGLSLQLPWMNRLGAKFSVKVESVYIHIIEVPFPDQQERVFNSFSDEIRRKKFRVVAEAERNQAPFGSAFRHILSQVLERIELQVENCRAVVEFADGSTGTFTVAELSAYRPDSTSAQHTRTLVISIEFLSAFIKGSSGDDPLNIPNVSISLGIRLDDDALKVNLDISRRVDISVHSSLREFIHSLKLRRAQWWSAHLWERPRSCVRADALSWMRYAYRRVLATHGSLRVRFDLEKLRHSLRSFVEYKNLHVRRLNKFRLKPEEIIRIAELEKSFDSELILLLRHAAQRDFAADEVSQFGTSEWLRWILFGHQMSSERERLTADVRRSLEESTGPGTITDAARKQGGGNQDDGERYAFQCRLSGLSVHVISGKHELELSLMRLSSNVGLNSTTGYYNVELLFEHLFFLVNGDIVARLQSIPRDRSDAYETPQLTAALSQSSDGISANVYLHSISVMLQPTNIEACSFVLQQWTSPLLPIVFDRHEYKTQGCMGPGHSRNADIFCASAICTVGNMQVLLFDDRNISGGKGSALTASLTQIVIRSPQSRNSFTPELNCMLSFQGVEFDAHAKPTIFPEPEATESTIVSERQQFFSVSTHVQLEWNRTFNVRLNNAVGFIYVPNAISLMSKLSASCSSQVFEAVSSKYDEVDVHSDLEPVFETSDVQQRFFQSESQFIVSSLRINILWGSQTLNHLFFLEIKQWETKLSSPTFSLASMRFGNVCLSSSAAKPFLLSIEPISDFEHAIRLKRSSHTQIDGHFFEVLIGDVSSNLCPDVVLAVAALVTDIVEKSSDSPRTVCKVSSSETDEDHSLTLLSLLVTSLKVQWSDAQFHTKISCSDLQVAAEGNQVSGSAETIILTKLNLDCHDSSSAPEVILRVTDHLNPVKPAVRFLYEPAGLHIGLNNLTASARRLFWGPLILSIGSVLQKLEERHDCETVSNFEDLQDDNRGMPIKIEGSGILLLLVIPKPDSPEIYADISQVVVLLQPGLQSLSFRSTSIMSHVDTVSGGLWGTQSRESTCILQTAGLDIEHKTVISLQDAGKSVYYSDTWGLTAPNRVSLTISPQLLSTLRIGLAELLSPCRKTECANPSYAETDTRAGTPTPFAERTRIIFRGSIKSLKLCLRSDEGGINGEVFAAIEAQEICLSTAEVRDRIGTGSCDIVVLSWLASCSTFHLMKCQPSPPEPWRIAIGCDTQRLTQKFPSRSHQGVSVRFVSRQDHGRVTTQFNIRVGDASVMFDPGLYGRLSRFITECSHRLNLFSQETLMETRKSQNGKHEYHQTGGIAAVLDSVKIPESSSSTSTAGDTRMASNHSSLAKVDVIFTNFTLLYSLDKDRDSVYSVRLHIRRTIIAMIVSNLADPMNGSTVRLEGISFLVSAIPMNTRLFVRSISEDQTMGSSTYGTQEMSNGTQNCTQMPRYASSAAGLQPPELGTVKFVTTVGRLSVTLKHSQEDELDLSVGNVSVDTSIHNLLRLQEAVLRYAARSPSSAETFPYSNFIAQPRLRVCLESVTLTLTVDHSSSVPWDDATPHRGLMTVDLCVSLQCVAHRCLQTSEGTIRLSSNITDNSSGHRDQLIAPGLLRYRVKKTRGYTIEAEIRELLRLSFSPLTIRTVSAVVAALQSSDLLASNADAPLAILESELRLIIRIYGLAVRCLSDVPRIQVLRLLLVETRFDATFAMGSGSRIMDFSVREFLLEDTISWRLFGSDPMDSGSRRWERIIASVRRQDDLPVPLSPGSPQDLGMSDIRRHTTRAPYDFFASSTRSALLCHITWRDYFEDSRARIYSSGVDLNLDLSALPVIQEWYRGMVGELPPDRSSSLSTQDGSSQEVVRGAPWFSELHVEPFSVTGSIRAVPRRLQESVYERLLTTILNFDPVTGLSLHLPTIHIQRKQSLRRLQQALFSYSSTITRQLIWQAMMQTGRVFRAASMFLLSLLRQRPYNPLRVSAAKCNSLGTRNGRSVGLLAALEVGGKSRSHSRDVPLLVQRVVTSDGIVTRRGNTNSSVDVVDLTYSRS